MPASPETVTPAQQLRAYVDYLRDLGIHDFYHREDPKTLLSDSLRKALTVVAPTKLGAPGPASGTREVPPQRPAAPVRPAAPTRQSGGTWVEPTRKPAAAQQPPSEPAPEYAFFDTAPTPPLPPEYTAPMPKPQPFDQLAPLPTQIIPAAQRPAALQAIIDEIGDCTRCPLAYAGRHKIVFSDGDPSAKLMFVGEGPGADEDEQGLPFVGKAGQLLNNMINAMGLQRSQVYIANIVKCRPPANRTPEFVEATTCSPFLLKQIDIVRPQVIVALGSTAATYLLGVRQSLSSLRGKWYETRGAKLAITYHPAFLLRDPRQKAEAWKDLQMVMKELGLSVPQKKA